MFAQMKTGFGTDQGLSRICRVHFSKTWQAARFHALTLRRHQGIAGNVVVVDSGDGWWLSGLKRDRTDARFRFQQPNVDNDVLSQYEDFSRGAPIPGRDHGEKSPGMRVRKAATRSLRICTPAPDEGRFASLRDARPRARSAARRPGAARVGDPFQRR